MKKDVNGALVINSETAEAFLEFSQHLGKDPSTGLQLMLDFFKYNNLSPLDELGSNFNTLETRINKRINAVIAILKEIEKTQTRPTHSMLQVLFQENPGKTSEILVEKDIHFPNQKDIDLQLPIPIAMEEDLRNKLDKRTEDMQLLLSKIVTVRNSYGSPYFKLNISVEDFIRMKSEI